ncbi:GDSL-type esterase/lipase family protein [Streptosporangium sp. NPDC051023]|uniref:SGNH/GDSL hydrolase family protein n=1 Tax=Streptosporangium sp. NPDC051023 TaxID=3155410 RepID=UPI00345042AC
MNAALIERLIRFQHPEKALGYLGGLDDARIAALFGLQKDAYLRVRQAHEEQVRQTAADLLDDPGFAKKVDALPFSPGQNVVAVGESTTDDLLSWFEILRHLIALRRPDDGITLVNAAVSGQTTTQALSGFSTVVFQRPDWVLCMLGGNDARRLGGADGLTLVGLSETERNLRALRDLVTRRTSARWAWLAPSPVDEARVAAYQPFQRIESGWSNRDLDPIGRFLATQPEPVVDSGSVIAGQGAESFHLDDGVHLSLAGQRALAAALVETLADSA